MADTVSHKTASAVPYYSTTALLRHAHHCAGGDVLGAIEVLRKLAPTYVNGWSAVRVLQKKLAKHPGCDMFEIERSGFVALSPRPSRNVSTILIGDLRFEQSGASMAVYDATLPWPAAADSAEDKARVAAAAQLARIDLPDASEFTFFRAAHAYIENAAPLTPTAA